MDRFRAAFQRYDFLSRGNFPKVEGTVLATGEQAFAIGRKSQTLDRIPICQEKTNGLSFHNVPKSNCKTMGRNDFDFTSASCQQFFIRRKGKAIDGIAGREPLDPSAGLQIPTTNISIPTSGEKLPAITGKNGPILIARANRTKFDEAANETVQIFEKHLVRDCREIFPARGNKKEQEACGKMAKGSVLESPLFLNAAHFFAVLKIPNANRQGTKSL